MWLRADTARVSTSLSPVAAPAARPGVDTLPWVQDRRRSPIRDAAAPLLLPALRRLAHEPPTWHRPGELDKGRATQRRLAHIASWHRLHDPHPDDALTWLPHVAPVLRGVGLTPSRVAEVLVSCRLAGSKRVPDDDLLTCAHVSVFEVIDSLDMPLLVRDGGWTPQDLLTWSQQFPAGHLAACEGLRLSHAGLREQLRAGTAPSVEQVTLMAAMRGPVPGIPAPVD